MSTLPIVLQTLRNFPVFTMQISDTACHRYTDDYSQPQALQEKNEKQELTGLAHFLM